MIIVWYYLASEWSHPSEDFFMYAAPFSHEKSTSSEALIEWLCVEGVREGWRMNWPFRRFRSVLLIECTTLSDVHIF